MPTQSCNTEYFVGQGKVFVAHRASAGAIDGGWYELGDTERLEVTVDQDFLDWYESCSGNRNQAGHINTQTDWGFMVEAKSFSKENLARAFRGTASSVTGAGVTNEAHTAYALNQILALAHPNVSAVTVNQVGQAALTVNVDYTIDADWGTITLISATNLVGAAPWSMEIDYTFATHEKVETATAAAGEYAFRFQGLNLTTNKVVNVTMHRVALNMTSLVSWIGTDQENRFPLEGRMLADPSAGSGVSQYMTIVKAV